MAGQIGINNDWMRVFSIANATSFDDFGRGQRYLLSFKNYTNYPSELEGNHCFVLGFGAVDQYTQMVYGLSDNKLAIRKFDRPNWSEWTYFFGYSTLAKLAAALKPLL